MRKFFYSIGVFMFLCVLSMGYYGSYLLTERRTEASAPDSKKEEPAQAVNSAGAGENTYCLKEEDGYVVVFKSDGVTLYETTSIVASLLPGELRKEIQNGKYIYSQEELYRFLENYSS